MKIKYIKNTHDDRAEKINWFVEKYHPEMITEEAPDIIVVAGGDGTLMHAMKNNKDYQAKFFGIGTGTINFLMNDVAKMAEVIGMLSEGSVELHSYPVYALNIHIEKDGEQAYLGEAINDVVLGNSIMDYQRFLINTDDNHLDNLEVRGTGLCLSTWVGSTAYNFNNFGTVLPVESTLWSLTGIACDKYLNDMLNCKEVRIKILNDRYNDKVFIDGLAEVIDLEDEDELVITHGREIFLSYLDKSELINKRIDLINSRRR